MRGRIIAACAAACGLPACTPAPTAAEAMFPLQAGHRWTYRVTTQTGEDASERETLTLRTLGRASVAELGGEPLWHRRSDSGLDYWLRADATGVYRVASKSDLDAEPRRDTAHRYVLKLPLAIGTQWQAPTAPYLLMRRNEFPREIRHAHPEVLMSYQIDALDQAVDVPAGHFTGCLRVRGTAAVRVYADPASGWRDMPLNTLEWYCRGVGLVRLERTEPAKSAFLLGGSRTLELESWQ